MSHRKKADLNDGFTMIANDILPALYHAGLTAREHDVVLFIIDHTYRFKHDEWELSNSFIGKELGMSRSHTCEIVDKLVKKCIITKHISNKNRQVLGINRVLSEWAGVPVEGNTQCSALREQGVPWEGNESVPWEGNKNNKEIIKKNKCVGENGKSRFPVTQIFDRLWSEWSFSQAGKDRVPRKVRAEIEGIGYARMNDARKRYEEDLRTRPTKNNQPLSARTWFTGGYIQFLPKIEDNGLWRSIEGKAYFREERLD